MNTRKIVIGALVVIIVLPVVLVVVAVGSFYVSFYALDRANGTIISSGQEQEYLLYVPPSYDHGDFSCTVWRPTSGISLHRMSALGRSAIRNRHETRGATKGMLP
jgi:hypothetical protein